MSRNAYKKTIYSYFYWPSWLAPQGHGRAQAAPGPTSCKWRVSPRVSWASQLGIQWSQLSNRSGSLPADPSSWNMTRPAQTWRAENVHSNSSRIHRSSQICFQKLAPKPSNKVWTEGYCQVQGFVAQKKIGCTVSVSPVLIWFKWFIFQSEYGITYGI